MRIAIVKPNNNVVENVIEAAEEFVRANYPNHVRVGVDSIACSPGMIYNNGVFTAPPEVEVLPVQPPWIGVAFQSGWENFGNGYAVGAYRRYANGLVEIKGMVKKNGVVGTREAIATLPQGYRPSEIRQIGSATAGLLVVQIAAQVLELTPAGVIQIVTGDASRVNLQFGFMAEQ